MEPFPVRIVFRRDADRVNSFFHGPLQRVSIPVIADDADNLCVRNFFLFDAVDNCLQIRSAA